MAEISSPRRSLKASPPRSILNAQLWQHYVRNEHGACLLLIERELRAFGGQSEFPLYVKGCIERQRGRLTQSLQLFQAATCLNPRSVANLKQVGRGLYLIGKFRHALEVYDEAKRIAPEDWQVWHNVGCCHAKLSAPDEAMDAFRMADSMGHHDVTYTQMASLHVDRGDFDAAIDVLLDAADFTAQNADILTRIGACYHSFFSCVMYD
jgi:Bardet-Biedl syndrome 4 protein